MQRRVGGTQREEAKQKDATDDTQSGKENAKLGGAVVRHEMKNARGVKYKKKKYKSFVVQKIIKKEKADENLFLSF